ncbi:GntR family transcriptional regulator [Parafrankia sp. FMc2]|uniref:GntR family transcriptional regulator n=1 Tax=Parafrankia sp. FMc2 TaxID=3233196 RepID=UPI0034D63DA2
MSPTDPPTYQRIAAILREEIESGTYQPGDRLQPQRALQARFGVASETMRRAMDQLQAEGIVVARGQAGTYVQERPSVRRVSTEFHRRARPASGESTSPFARSVAATSGRASWDHVSVRETADEAVAARLDIEVGSAVMATRYLYRYDGTPIQTATSWEPLALTEGTSIELPEEGAAVGVVARFDLIDLHIDSVVEELTARPPTADEVQALELPPGVSVMQQQRTYYVGDQAVETANIVMAGHRTVVAYRLAVT